MCATVPKRNRISSYLQAQYRYRYTTLFVKPLNNKICQKHETPYGLNTKKIFHFVILRFAPL